MDLHLFKYSSSTFTLTNSVLILVHISVLLLKWEQRILEYEFWGENGQFANTPVIHIPLKDVGRNVV